MALCFNVCAGAGAGATGVGTEGGVDIVALCSREDTAGLCASKKPAPGLVLITWSMAMAFSAAGVRGSDSREAIGLIAGCINDWASSSSPYMLMSSANVSREASRAGARVLVGAGASDAKALGTAGVIGLPNPDMESIAAAAGWELPAGARRSAVLFCMMSVLGVPETTRHFGPVLVWRGDGGD
jgi:hypothetical protein